MKSKTQTHTPGPWHSSSMVTGRVQGLDGNYIAAVYDKPNQGEQLANERLIAAAPDLLEAAKLWLETMRQNDAPEYSVQMRIVRAAIAKAEGK